MTDLHQQAQEQGEEALRELMDQADEGGCMCETCVVREILTAAYPTLLQLARLELDDSTTGVLRDFAQVEH